MAFNVGYTAGGIINKVEELPYPHFSKNKIPYIKGRVINAANTAPEARTYIDQITLPYDVEFLSIAMACSIYHVGDYWEFDIGGITICETIYTKELPESVSMGNSFGIVYPIPANTCLKFTFFNSSGKPKAVWYNVKFLR